MKNAAEKYIDQITSGEINCGKYERLAVERHVTDLQEGINRGLYFDRNAANKALRWFTFLKHSKGKQFTGKPFILADWQAFTIWSIFGWMRADGTRRFRKAYISVAKKNGKTTFAAGIALYMLKADGESRAEVYSAATKRDQAKICFDEAKSMVRTSPGLTDYFSIYTGSIFDELNGSYFQPLSSDSDKQDGLNPHFAIIDEYHAHKNDELVDNIQSGMGARVQPLLLQITTAGFNRHCPCYDEEQACKKILEGILDQDDKFALIFALDKGDDYNDPSVWRKANPNMDISVTKEFIQGEYDNAMNNKRKLSGFLTKNLNLWVETETTWIEHKVWKACNFGYFPEKLKGRKCWGGLDLAANVDFNALALIFEEDENGIIDILVFFWIPEEKCIESRDGVDYKLWEREGWIKTTPGNVIDIDIQIDDIHNICKDYDVVSIAFDTHRAYHGVTQALLKEGIDMIEYRQRTIEFDAPTRELEKLVLSKKINHGGNPVMAWMISNSVIMEDTSGNIKVSKGKSSEKVDGVISTIMAIGIKMANNLNNYFNFS